MKLEDIKKSLHTPAYDFLRTNEHLGDNIILLGLGGSHAYGTDVATSDVDLRGVTINTRRQLLTNENFEQVTEDATDTVIYSFNKVVSLLSNLNPNVCEMLGLKPDHYLYVHPLGQELLDNVGLFLSKKCVHSFGGYAAAQFRRLENRAVRNVDQEMREKHILNSIKSASFTFPERYFEFPDGAINLYVDKAVQEGYDTEIFMDVNLKHYPLRDYKTMWAEMHNIVKDYSKIGKRNSKAIEHGKLAKHMMHLIRLYMMCIDILENEKIVTYREKEHDLLMDIRNGKYLDENQQPVTAFFEMVEDFQKRMAYAEANTALPDKPNYKRINDFVESVNYRVVTTK